MNVFWICLFWFHLQRQRSHFLFNRRLTWKKGGGVVVLISNNPKYRVRDGIKINDCPIEYLLIELKTNQGSVLVAPVYRLPNAPQKESIDGFVKLVAELKKNSKSIIVGLDHNLDLLKPSLGRRDAPRSKFFQLHAISRPLLWEILDPPLEILNDF